ncbi:MAG TPA: GatB/YqeY domain-containing protein [Acidimicrobiia bacterium]|nr:GatB/YqeY domain-containing protein [Acidimicrobiia bacterium]
MTTDEKTSTSKIKSELAAELKDAMKSGDARRRDVIRQVETEVRVVTSQPGVGEATDEVYQVVIGAYVKKMAKARDEYREMGEKGAEMADKLAFEVDYLARWLPDKLGAADTRRLVQQTIQDMQVSQDPKAVGKVVGALMRTRQDLDGALVNRLAREELEG